MSECFSFSFTDFKDLSLVLASFSTVAIGIGSLYLNRKNMIDTTIKKSQQEWIDKLRNEVSNFIAIRSSLAIMHIPLKPSKPTFKGIQSKSQEEYLQECSSYDIELREFSSKTTILLERLTISLNVIELLLNKENEEHQILLQELLLFFGKSPRNMEGKDKVKSYITYTTKFILKGVWNEIKGVSNEGRFLKSKKDYFRDKVKMGSK